MLNFTRHLDQISSQTNKMMGRAFRSFANNFVLPNYWSIQETDAHFNPSIDHQWTLYNEAASKLANKTTIRSLYQPMARSTQCHTIQRGHSLCLFLHHGRGLPSISEFKTFTRKLYGRRSPWYSMDVEAKSKEQIWHLKQAFKHF